MSIDTTGIEIRQYDAYWNGVKLPPVSEGSLGFSLGSRVTVLDTVHQIEGVVKAWERDVVPQNVRMTFLRTDPSFIKALIEDRITVSTSGSAMGLGIGKGTTTDLLAISGELLLHPTGVPLSNKENDVKFWKATPVLENVDLMGSRENVQELQINWYIFPDLDRDTSRYGVIGDWSIIDSDAPLGVFIQLTGPNASAPYKHISALTLPIGAIDRLQAYAIYGDDSSDALYEAAINDATDISATDTSIVFDGLGTASLLQTGQIIGCGTEKMYINSVTYNSGNTSGLIDVVRGIGGTTAASHLDNAVITLVRDVTIGRARDAGTWASSDATKVTVGTTYGSSTEANKPGVIKHIATGSANITVTKSAVASPNCAITAP